MVIALLLAVGTQILLGAPSHAGGLGGGLSFDDKSRVALSQGQNLPPVQYIWIENTGDAPADVAFEAVAPDGVSVTTATPNVTIQPGKRHQFDFGVTVAPTVPPGDYTILVQGKQTNTPKQPGSNIPVAPGVGGRFGLTVTGESANVTIKSVSENDGTPIAGRLSLAYIPGAGRQPFVVKDLPSADSLSITTAPGNYRATFEISGLITKDVDFTLANGESKEVQIKLTAVYFVVNGALANPRSGDIVAVDLVASVKNNLRPVEGPISIEVNVKRDGQDIETVPIHQQPVLPIGLSEGRESWRPPDGWQPGSYSFEFVLRTPTFNLTSAVVPTIDVPKPFPLVMVGTVVCVIIIVAGAWFFLARSRRRRSR